MAVTYTGDVNFAGNGTPSEIGDTGSGSLVVDGGSTETWVYGVGDSRATILGFGSGTDGAVTVTGIGSLLDVNGSGSVNIGESGFGSLDLLSGGVLEFDAGVDGNARLNLGSPSIFSPRAGGNAALTIDDATMVLRGLDAQLRGYSLEETVSVDIRNGSTVKFEGNSFAGFQLGYLGEAATFALTGGSTMTLDTVQTPETLLNLDPGTFFNLGRTFGTANAVIDGSTLNLFSDFSSGMSVGRSDAGSVGTLAVNNGSQIDIRAEDDSAFLNVGRDSATGTMTMFGSSILMNATGTGTGALLRIGRDGGTGTIESLIGTIDLTSAEGLAAFQIGVTVDVGALGGDGTAFIDEGSRVAISGDMALLAVGDGDGTSGNLSVAFGSRIVLNGTSSSPEASRFIIGSEGSRSATVSIAGFDGIESAITGADVTTIGTSQSSADDPFGTGSLTLTDGALLESGDVAVAANGSLTIGGARGLLTLDGSTIRMPTGNPNVFGTLSVEGDLVAGTDTTIVGNINIDGGRLTLALGNGRNPSLGTPVVDHQNGTLIVDQATRITIDPDNYDFRDGDTSTLIQSANSPANNLLRRADFAVEGQAADFGWALTQTDAGTGSSLAFLALNDGTTGNGRADLDLGADITDDIRFAYRTGDREGYGVVGQDTAIRAYNLDGIRGGEGDDRLSVSGSDSLLLAGRDGRDVLTGGDGDDTLEGGNGNDVLTGGLGADALSGGDGRDIATYANSATGVRADLADISRNTRDARGDTYDSIEDLRGSIFDDDLSGDALRNRLFGGDGDDDLYGRNGNDLLIGGAGDDILNGGAGRDVLSGGTGNDTATYADALSGLTADLTRASNNRGSALGDSYSGIENLIGSSFDDVLRGNAAANGILGGTGDDILFGRAGDDFLIGAAGNDIFVGGAGADTFSGGGGIDRAVYTDSATGVTAALNFSVTQTGIAAGDRFLSIEQLTGSSFDDRLIGNGVSNVLVGGAGDDILLGEGSNDTLSGGAGDDVLLGGRGADMLSGGAGADRFRFDDIDAVDTILDFSTGDRFVLNSDAFASLSRGALPVGAFRAGDRALDADDRVLYDAPTGRVLYDADADGAGAAVVFAMVRGAPVLDAGDFAII